MQLIINQNWFRQWLGTEKTLSHYLSQRWSRPMVHIWVSRIDWVDYFTILGKYIHAEKNGTLWAHEGNLHTHSWKWAIPTPQVGSGRGTGWPYFVKFPQVLSGGSVTPTPTIECNGSRGENRGPFKGQQASASNPVMLPVLLHDRVCPEQHSSLWHVWCT